MSADRQLPEVQRLIATAYGASVALFSLGVASFALRFHHTVFGFDDWRVLSELASKPWWERLLTPQNGHIMPATLAIFHADYAFFGGRAHLLVAMSLLYAFAAIAVIVATHGLGRESPTPLDRAVQAFMAFLLVWAGLLHSFLWGLASVNPLTLLWALVAVGCLIRFIDRERSSQQAGAWLFASTVSAIIATFSFGTGFATWGALLAIALAGRAPKRVLIGLAGVAAGSLAVYALDLRLLATQNTPPLPGPEDVLRMLKFVAGFVGSAAGWALEGVGVVRGWDALYAAAVVVGGVAMAGFTVYALRTLLRSQVPDPRTLFALGLMTFAIVAGATAGAARSRLWPMHAVNSRFLIWSVVFWMGAACGLSALPALSRNRRRSTLTIVALALASLLMLPVLETGLRRHFGREGFLARASLSLLLGIESEKIATGLAFRPEFVPQALDLLRRDERGPFSDPRRAWLGRPLAGPRAEDPNRCAGATERIKPVVDAPGHVRISGWARDKELDGVPNSVVITDSDGIVRGLANMDTVRPWQQSERRRSWTGYVVDFDEAERYTVLAVLPGNLLCPLSSSPRRQKRKNP